MSKKFETPFDDTKKIFDELILKYNLDNYMNIDLIVDNRLKTLYKFYKSSDLYKFKTDIDVTILINEEIFEAISDESLKIIAAELILAGLSYDTEKDKLLIRKEDCNIHTGVVTKYGLESTYKVDRVVKELFEQKLSEKE
jgi:hypothetical protein